MAIFLSFGMDSAVLASLLARSTGNALALTVELGGPQGESDGARATAIRLGLRHEVLPLDDAFVCLAFARWLAALDQPSVDGFNIFLVTEAARAKCFKVAISGLGADELWGGYSAYKTLPRLKTWLAPVPVPVRAALGSTARILLTPRFGSIRAEKLQDLIGSAPSIEALYFASRRIFARDRLIALGFQSELPALLALPDSTLGRLSYLEREHYLRNTLLRDTDNMAMANGVEVRVPFLSRPLLDLAAALPDKVRFPPGGRRKEVLWRGSPDAVPASEATVAKRGFTLPFATWLNGPFLRDWKQSAIHALTLRADLATLPLANLLLTLERPGVDHTGARRLALCVLGDYLERHDLSVRRPRNS